MTSFLDGKVRLLKGDCLELLPTLEENSIDSIVTDPPYGLQFMGREWDKLWRNETGADKAYVERTKGELTSRARKLPDYSATKPAQMQAFHLVWAQEALRVLKPGAHLLAFSGTRTYHRMACAIEDAGFEIRDQIGWCYGSGFPKSHDVSKGIDRLAGAEREIVASRKKLESYGPNEVYGSGPNHGGIQLITAPATEAAIQWQGWGTALKPAWEPIVLARKPLSESSIAANVLKHGTGGINVDGCRVGVDTSDLAMMQGRSGKRTSGNLYPSRGNGESWEPQSAGRWPANLIHDGSEEVVSGFPDVGKSSGGCGDASKKTALAGHVYGDYSGETLGQNAGGLGDSGSAARFFYTAKADTNDRLGSKHPTVKPIDLIQYLARLITPRGGTIIDPFAGTGTLGEAAFREGFEAVLIEREPEYQADIERRMALVLAGPEERIRESIKARGLVEEAGPLFGGTG
jgi:DNA modification methylase